MELAGLDGFVVGLPVTSRGNIRDQWTDSVQVLERLCSHYLVCVFCTNVSLITGLQHGLAAFSMSRCMSMPLLSLHTREM